MDFAAGVYLSQAQNPASPTPYTLYTEPVFLNLLRSLWIDSQPGGPVRQPYLTFRPARLHRLAESIPRNRFLNVYKFGLCILIHTGKGGGIEQERRLEGQQFTKLGQKYQHDWLYLQSINSDRHLPQSPFIGQFLGWRHSSLVSIYLISPCSDPAVFLRGII
jgi:hypothetical protein